MTEAAERPVAGSQARNEHRAIGAGARAQSRAQTMWVKSKDNGLIVIDVKKLYIQEIAYKRIGSDRPIVMKQTLIYTYTDTPTFANTVRMDGGWRGKK